MAGKINLAIPRAPSPFIRACRWSALIVGVFAGSYQLKRFRKIEEKFKIQQAPLIVKLEEKQAREKITNFRAEMLSLYREANGRDPPPGHVY